MVPSAAGSGAACCSGMDFGGSRCCCVWCVTLRYTEARVLTRHSHADALRRLISKVAPARRLGAFSRPCIHVCCRVYSGEGGEGGAPPPAEMKIKATPCTPPSRLPGAAHTSRNKRRPGPPRSIGNTGESSSCQQCHSMYWRLLRGLVRRPCMAGYPPPPPPLPPPRPLPPSEVCAKVCRVVSKCVQTRVQGRLQQRPVCAQECAHRNPPHKGRKPRDLE